MEKIGMTPRVLAGLVVTLVLVFAPLASATTPGPTRVLQCPGSTEVVLLPSLMSGNTFSGTVWSDGEADFPMLPQFPLITRCGSGGALFWTDRAEVVDTIDPMQMLGRPDAAQWTDAKVARFLSASEYLEAIATGLGDDPQRLQALRLLAWRAANDCRRDELHMWSTAKARVAPCRTSPFPSGSPARANLEALVRELPVHTPSDRLLQAEMLRELGRFDEALHALDSAMPNELEKIVLWMRQRIAEGDAEVHELPR